MIHDMTDKSDVSKESPFQKNRHTLLAALQSVGATHVEVTFEGSGDSGCVEDVHYTWLGNSGDENTDNALDELQVPWNCSEGLKLNPQTNQWEKQYKLKITPLRTVIEEFSYELLDQDHGGWENDEGAYGMLEIDVITSTIRLVFNERYLEVKTFEQEY